MLSNNKDWFYKDSYYHRWHRVLVRGGGDQYPQQISIPLTPVNLESKGEWSETSQVCIQRHEIRYSAFKDTGYWTHHLPDEIHAQMVEKMGKAKADFMVHADILPLIDWKVWERHNNNGCYLDVCQEKIGWMFVKNVITPTETVSNFLNQERFLIALDRVAVVGEMPLGGLIIEAPDYDVRFIINYDMSYDLIVAEVRYSNEDSDHISRFSKRFNPQWGEQLTARLKSTPMAEACKDNYSTLANLSQVILTAEAGMSLLKTKIEPVQTPISNGVV